MADQLDYPHNDYLHNDYLHNDDQRLSGAWHPVAQSIDVAPGDSAPTRLLGRRLTVSRDAGGLASVAGSWGAAERYGLVWAALTEPTEAGPYEIPELATEGFHADALVRRTSASAGVVVDNFLDVTHFSYLHQQSFGRSRPVTHDGYALQASGQVVRLEHDTVLNEMRRTPDGGVGQRRIATYTYQPPFWAHLQMYFPDDGERSAATLICRPETSTSTVVYVVVAISDSDPGLADQVAFSLRVLDEDLVVLEQLVDQRLPLLPQAEQHTRADRAAIEMRRTLATWLAARSVAPEATSPGPGWVAVTTLAELDRAAGGPVPVRAEGRAWAVLRLDGEVVALLDRCPHRRVPLSAGTITAAHGGQRLQCSYHGWSFDGSGRCVEIPALGNATRLPGVGMSATPAAVKVVGDVVWLDGSAVVANP